MDDQGNGMGRASQGSGRPSVGVAGACAIGVGGMMGAGLYTLIGLATVTAGYWLALSFIVGGCVAGFSVYSYSKLGTTFPSRGGAAQFLIECFGDGLVAGGMNVFQYLGWIIAMALYASGFSEYACALFGISDGGVAARLISVGIIIVVVCINVMGSAQVARAQTVIIGGELLILAAFIVFGLKDVVRPLHESSKAFSPFGVLSAAGLLYVTYEGFGVVTNAAADMKDPRRQLPRAMYLALVIVMTVYVVCSMVVVSTLGVAGAQAHQGHALADAARLVLGDAGFTAISVAALVATASAVNSTMFGDNNLAIQVAQIDEIPSRFNRKTPMGGTRGLFITATLTMVFVVVFPLSMVGEMASLAFLLVYACVNAGHLRVYGKTGARKSLLILSVAFNLGLFAVLLGQTIRNDNGITAGCVAGLFIFSFALEAIWRRHTGRNMNLLGRVSDCSEADHRMS